MNIWVCIIRPVKSYDDGIIYRALGPFIFRELIFETILSDY